MRLRTMEPNPAWDAASYEGVVETLGGDDYAFKVWGGDWCKDCRSQLPDFAAALDAADVPEERIEHYPVEKAEDGSKVGPGVDEYGIDYIPTVVVERPAPAADGPSGERSDTRDGDGEELARFVEEEDVPVAVYLAERLREAEREASA